MKLPRPLTEPMPSSQELLKDPAGGVWQGVFRENRYEAVFADYWGVLGNVLLQLGKAEARRPQRDHAIFRLQFRAV